MEVSIVFGFILTLIVLAFVLLFGAGTINDLFGLSGDAQFGNQITEIQKLACGQARDSKCLGGLYWRIPGDSERYKIGLPGGFSKVCFVDPDSDLYRSTETWDGEDSIAINQIQVYKFNVYGFKPSGESIGKIVPSLKPAQNFCVSKTGELILSSKGQYVEVSEQV